MREGQGGGCAPAEIPIWIGGNHGRKKARRKGGEKTSSAKAKTKAETKTTTADTTSPAPKGTNTAEKTNPQVTQATVTAEGGVNVRTSPEKGDNIQRVLPYGAEVTIQAQTTDTDGIEWAQIAPKEFVMRRFLKTV